MSLNPVDLSPGQLRRLAESIHGLEVDSLAKINFSSYEEQQKYLTDATAARTKVYHILDSSLQMITETKAEKDTEKQNIARDVYEYCHKAIETCLEYIRSYHTRISYLDKLASHSDDLIKRLKSLNPATQQEEAERLALEAGTYKRVALGNARKFQSFVPNEFTRWLKNERILFEDLVQSNMNKHGFTGPFKDLGDIQKLQVYDSIMVQAGHGEAVVTYSSEELGEIGVPFLIFTGAAMVWDIYTAENKMEAAIRTAVNGLSEVASVVIGQIVSAAVEAGFLALNTNIAAATIAVIGAVAGAGVGVLIGAATGLLLDLIFSSGTTMVELTDGLSGCMVAPLPNGLEQARLIKYYYPDL